LEEVVDCLWGEIGGGGRLVSEDVEDFLDPLPQLLSRFATIPLFDKGLFEELEEGPPPPRIMSINVTNPPPFPLTTLPRELGGFEALLEPPPPTEPLRPSAVSFPTLSSRAHGVNHSFGIIRSTNGMQELTYANRLTQFGGSFPHNN